MHANRIGVAVVAFFLTLSIFAYIFTFIPSSQEEKFTIPLYTNSPLTKKEIEEIIKKDKVLVIYIWSFDCENCGDYENNLLQLLNEFNGSVYLNSLNTYDYPNLPYLDIPYLIIMGKNGKKEFKINLPNSTELKEDICYLFENPPENCKNA